MMVFLPLFCMAEEMNVYEFTQNGYQATMQQKYWDSFDHTHSGFDTPEDFLRYAVEAIERIVAWGGEPKRLTAYREAGSDVVLSVQFMTTSDISRVLGSNYGKEKQTASITLKDSYLAFQIAPIIHELTHVVYPIAYSRTLRDGLASYLQDELGEYGMVHNFGLNPHEICQNVILPIEYNQNLFGFIGSMSSGSKAASEQRSSFYVASQSFMAYLIETYGIDVSMKIYSSMDEDVYAEQTGKTLEEIRRDWLLYLKRYESDFTAETIRQNAYETLLRHGASQAGAASLSEWVYQQYIE